MLKPIGLTEGHYECRKLDETLPVLAELCAMKLVERHDGQAILQHPNTPWKLVVHEGGADAPDKPHNNHYGLRVASDKEVTKAEAKEVRTLVKSLREQMRAKYAPNKKGKTDKSQAKDV